MDLIQSEYGWSDETVMELAVCRLRQITAVIDERLRALRLQKSSLIEWQTKTLASFIAATVPTEKGKKNELAEAAQKISLQLEGAGDEQKRKSDPSVYVEQGSQVAENRIGSYERLMGGLG